MATPGDILQQLRDWHAENLDTEQTEKWGSNIYKGSRDDHAEFLYQLVDVALERGE